MSDAVAKKAVSKFGEHLATLDDTPAEPVSELIRSELDALTTEVRLTHTEM